MQLLLSCWLSSLASFVPGLLQFVSELALIFGYFDTEQLSIFWHQRLLAAFLFGSFLLLLYYFFEFALPFLLFIWLCDLFCPFPSCFLICQDKVTADQKVSHFEFYSLVFYFHLRCDISEKIRDGFRVIFVTASFTTTFSPVYGIYFIALRISHCIFVRVFFVDFPAPVVFHTTVCFFSLLLQLCNLDRGSVLQF